MTIGESNYLPSTKVSYLVDSFAALECVTSRHQANSIPRQAVLVVRKAMSRRDPYLINDIDFYF